MPHANPGTGHYHRRKRIHQKHEPYPHPNKWKRFMDKAIYFIIPIGIIMTLPQIYKIWIEQNAGGISLISWTTYLIGAIVWLIYGFLHKEKPIIIGNIFWILTHTTIIIGTILYG